MASLRHALSALSQNCNECRWSSARHAVSIRFAREICTFVHSSSSESHWHVARSATFGERYANIDLSMT